MWSVAACRSRMAWLEMIFPGDHFEKSRVQHGWSCKNLETYHLGNVEASPGVDSNASGMVRVVLKCIPMPVKLRFRQCRQTGKDGFRVFRVDLDQVAFLLY